MSKLSESSLFQLTSARFRLFFREPEAVFWIFVFPILLSVGLSIAFRNRPADVLQVGATTAQLAQSLNADKGLRAITLSTRRKGSEELATGKILLLAVQAPGGVVFDYDDTNPDARTARLIADRALEKAAGQRESVQITSQQVHEAGARYIDFVIPGLLGMNLMSSAIWGLGFSIVEARQKKLLKRLVASPMPRWQYLASFLLSRLLLLVIEVGVFLGFARLVFGVPFRGPIWQLALVCVLASLSFSALGLLIASRAKTMEAASGLDEPGDAADVDRLRGLFLGEPVSGYPSAVHSRVAADGGDRCVAGQYAAGVFGAASVCAGCGVADLAAGFFCGCAADIPVAVERPHRQERVRGGTRGCRRIE